MASNRRELVLAIVSDASQITRGFDQATQGVNRMSRQFDNAARGGVGRLDSRINAVSASFRSLTAIAAGGIVGQKVIGFAQDAISAYSTLNESINAVNVSFGRSADEILRIGDTADRALGLSKAAFNALAVSYSAFTRTIAQGTGQDVVDVLDALTTRTADFASVMDLEVAQAGDTFRSIMAGSSEVARRYGLDISAAAVNQYALAEGLAASKSEITESDKVLARYQLLMAQTSQMAGDFANTSDELANSSRSLGAQWENLQAQLGEELAPVAEEAVARFSNLLSTLSGDVDLGWSQRLSAALQTLLGDSAESVAAYIEQKEAINQMADAGDNLDGNIRGVSNTVELFGREVASTAEAVSKAEWENNSLAEMREQFKAAEEAARNTRLTLLELASPAFAAIRAQERVGTAETNLQDLKDQGASVEDLARAEADLAEARIGSAAALERFDAAGVAGQIELIGTALGESYGYAKDLLTTLGVLDGSTFTVDGTLNLSTFYDTPPALGEIINGRPGAIQPLPTPAGSSTVNQSITINGNTDDGTVGQIAREMTIQSNAAYAEGNFR